MEGMVVEETVAERPTTATVAERSANGKSIVERLDTVW